MATSTTTIPLILLSLTAFSSSRTQASAQNGGGPYGLNFTGSGGNQVNVSSGAVDYSDQQCVEAAVSVGSTPAGSTNTTTGTTAAEPSADGASDSSKRSVGFVGLVLGLALFFMGD
ncbi:hypothetical protein M0R45_003198 [Rubus argutus]|uniref:Uncharacterized protein n=1 Tax=Rubus argutus TaxID=59490 RepID=A0AAW1YEC3_RUBAR